MRKLFAFVLAALTLVFMTVPFGSTAEAARVAVVPLQCNEKKVERWADFNSYYWDIIIEKFKYPEYELMDDEKVEAVVPETGLLSYDRETLMKLAQDLDAEIVVAMKLDEVSERMLNFRREQAIATFMQGEYASYNRLSDNYFHKKIYEKGEVLEVLTLRNDWQQRTFASEFKRCVNRTLEDKSRNKKKK